MDLSISKRMELILSNDKINDPQQICEVLKDEIRPIIENYITIKEDIKVRFKKENNKNIFWIEFNADRIKPFGYIKPWYT